jgi:hypothetical protein
MKVKYYEVDLERESKSDVIFLKNGDLWFFLSQKKKSRYFGCFIFYHNQALRFLDDIDFKDEIYEINILSPSEAIIYFKNNQAYLNLTRDSLEITFSSYQELKITFDIKAIFDNDPFKRKIKIEKISSVSFLIEEFFEGQGFIKLLIEADSPLNFQEVWKEKFFDFDFQRNSPPFNWYIFDGIYGKVREIKIKVVFPETRTDADYTRTNADKSNLPGFSPDTIPGYKPDISGNHPGNLSGRYPGKNTESLREPVLNFLLSHLNSLFLDNYLPAGFSWFYENWYRDELLSMFLLTQINSDSIYPNNNRINYPNNRPNENIFGQHSGKVFGHNSGNNSSLRESASEERIKFYLYNLENIWDKNKPNGFLAADTFLLFLLNLPQDLFLVHFNLLEGYLQKWQEKFNLDNLPSYSTWMDTLERKNALEIDVLYLKALRRFAKVNKNYVSLANHLKERIVKKIKENPIDVNLVFAFLFLEDIFTLNEWRNFFEKLLKENYLLWGGLATLPLNDPKFLDEDGGEKANAYHRGDSWYFLNNLLAYSLAKIDFKKFKNFIQKIIESSFFDLFFDGALGWSSEISSAKERRSEGSLVQTWSIASLVFLLSFLQNINISLESFSNSHNIITIKS